MTKSSATARRRELTRLREQIELAQARVELRNLQLAYGLSPGERFGDIVPDARGRPLMEAWGDSVDTRDYINDDPNFGFPLPNLFSVLSDRQFGKLYPIYQNEQDLMRIRGQAHNLATIGSGGTKMGIMDSLANYVLGKGFSFTAQPRGAKDSGSLPLCAALQRVIDRFLEENQFIGAADREAHHRSREDGEAFLKLRPEHGGSISLHFLECEQITQPAAPRELEDWLGCGTSYPSDWWFGIHTRHRATNKPLGYHVIYDGSLGDFDYLPAGDGDVPPALMVENDETGRRIVPHRLQHIKRNVTANAKRGVSDFYWILGDLFREAKIRRNTAEGVALQSAIAWIISSPPGSTQAAIQNIGSNDWFANYQKPVMNGGTKTQNASRYPPGTILKPSPGMQYEPGPMGSERCPNFMLVAQYILRSIGVRWNMPEYLISGDASNANYASTMVAESPFVKSREADQQFYRAHFAAMIWKVLRIAYDMGQFVSLGASWDSLKALIEIKVDVPAVESRDQLKMAQTQQVQIGLGILSRKTAAVQAGLDYEAEVQQGAAPETGMANAPKGGALPGALATAMNGADGGANGNAGNPDTFSYGARRGLLGPDALRASMLQRESELSPARGQALREAIETAESIAEARLLVRNAIGEYP